MVEEAERFKEDDEKAKELIDSRNNLENTIYQFKNTLSDEKMATLIDTSMKEELTKVVEENISWLENNQMASKEEYDNKLSEFQEAMKPLQEKMMSNMQGTNGVPENMPKTNSTNETKYSAPNIEEVD